MIEPSVARSSFVVPALTHLGLYSLDAEKLLMGTAATESEFQHFRQIGGGPARGMFQMEQATFDWLHDQFLTTKRHAELKRKVDALAAPDPTVFDTAMRNHRFAAGMARIRYYVARSAIPSDLNGQANYWYDNYNGRAPHGHGPKAYLKRWQQYCAGLYDGSQSAPDPYAPVSDFGDTARPAPANAWV